MTQTLVTVPLAFASERAPGVQAVLDRLGNPAAAGPRAALDATGIVHFMSLSVVPDTAPGLAHLMLELSADGGVEQALTAVYHALRPVLDDAIAAAGINCWGSTIPEFLARYNLRLGAGWRATTGIGFCGGPAMSVQRIRNEARIADEIAAMPDLHHPGVPAFRKLQTVRDVLWSQDEKWAFTAEPTPFLNRGLSRTPVRDAAMVAIASAKLARPLIPIPLLLWWWLGFWPALVLSVAAAVVGFGAATLYLRRLETTDPVDDTTPNAAKIEKILLTENTGAQNLLSAVSVMKVGWFRRVLLRLAFGVVGESVTRIFRPGFLDQIGVIHFARWALIPGTDRLMFWSNFSDGWESYLEDFIEKLTQGLTSIWSNTQGFPRTRFLFFQGAADGDRFRSWARRQQYAASFWYSAYPDLTMSHIRRNAAIRQGIADARTGADAEAWLSCFGSEPRPGFMLDKPQIPTLALGALRRLRSSACLILSLPDDPAAARLWLAGIFPHLTFGEAGREDPAAGLAFTRHGLLRLGLSETDLQTFPTPFQNGMTAPGRSRALGDTGDDAPETWLWGNAEATDAALLLYDCDAARLTTTIETVSRDMTDRGGAIAYLQRMAELPPGKEQVYEPFGFADGVSQPILRDTPRARAPHNAEHVVEAGEFILGYPDDRGYIPPTPTIQAANDPHRMLPEMGPPQTGVAPSFSGGGSNGQRDFGRDGTFLVIRHLEQDPRAFHAFAAAEANRLSGDATCPFAGQNPAALKTMLEAKMIGRWPDGGSLVRHAHPVPAGTHRTPDNDFLFGREDPQGLDCPFGAHIRRANPRDSLDTNSAEQLPLTNRHRILRVGRRYEAASDADKPGLMFMCLNADIERQFEFLQQTWIKGRSFHDLQNEQDPIVGHGAPDSVFTIPTRQGPVRLRGLPDFVRVRGGGYFFMPGRRALRFLMNTR